jgi:alkylhydroperoxidase family enzyme
MPYPELSALSPAKHARATNPNRRPLNVWRMAMHATEGIWQAFVDLGLATVHKSDLTDRQRELVILRVAYLEQSDYELFHHVSLGRAAGIGDAELEGLRTGDFSGFGESERALLAFTDGVFAGSPSDAALADMRAHFPDALVFETTIMIGHYMMTARVIAVGGCEVEDTPTIAWSKPT